MAKVVMVSGILAKDQCQLPSTVYLPTNIIFASMHSEIHHIIKSRTNYPLAGIKNTVRLLSEGATVPFISRYRKEMTGSLDEVAIEHIKNLLAELNAIIKRKETILKAIKEQGLLNNKLQKQIEACWDSASLEDLYLPYKKKVRTKATIARENGLEPLAKTIMAQQTNSLFFDAKKYTGKHVATADLALAGARHIISEWVNENLQARDTVRSSYKRHALIESKVVKSKKDQATKYESYFKFSEPLKKCPSHRLLAMYRGEKEGLLKINLSIDTAYAQQSIERSMIKRRGTDCADQITEAIQDALKRLVLPSIENEIKKQAKLRADKEAIDVFAKNLKDLLLASPLGEKKVLALDPGFRTGCKVVVLDKNGDLMHTTTIYPHPPQSSTTEAAETIKQLISKYAIDCIAIGNGTAGKETYRFIDQLKIDKPIQSYFVNESGASIYSASKLAREEFPDQDITVRGAVSIGRRLMDPLAELVKIDPKSIGVGQYQHDVDQKLLKESLDSSIASCVNKVGININTASKHLLTHVSGLGPVLAQNIIDYRTNEGAFTQRKELLSVPRMGKKAYEQAAGFLRIIDGTNILDNTSVHPESYALVKKISKDIKTEISVLVGNSDLLANLTLEKYVTPKAGLPTLRDIVKELNKPGLDPRGEAKVVSFSSSINTIHDLNIGMILPGVVNNVTKFGAFVDIGVKESGLVHISQIVNRFIKDPAEVLSVNQEVTVKVINVDIEKKRITLSMKEV